MREMKDSGIKWLNEIPSDWEIEKIKYRLIERKENNLPIKTNNILSLTAKQGVIPLAEKEGGGNKPKEDLTAYRLAYPGDIVMNSMNILSGSVGLSAYFGCVSPVYYMLRPQNSEEDVRFYNYIFQSTVFQKSLFGYGNGIMMKESGNGKLNTIRMRISMDTFGNLFIPIAPIDEQKRIATYLDEQCKKIDDVMADVQSQIDTLEDYKKSVISEAVTKGLNPDAEMKESGISYIGSTPKHWNIRRLKYILTERNERSLDGSEELLSVSQYYGVIPSSENKMRTMQAESLAGYKKVFIGDLVFNKLNPGLARFGESKYVGITSPDFAVYICNNECNAKFLQHLLKTNKYVISFKGIGCGVGDGFARLYTPQLYNFYVSLPPVNELNEICEYINNKCAKIDSIIEDKKAQLETIENYKKALIYEYVTGKKEVPNE